MAKDNYNYSRWSKKLIRAREEWIGRRVRYSRLTNGATAPPPAWVYETVTGTVVDLEDTQITDECNPRRKYNWTGYLCVQRDGTTDHRGEDQVNAFLASTESIS